MIKSFVDWVAELVLRQSIRKLNYQTRIVNLKIQLNECIFHIKTNSPVIGGERFPSKSDCQLINRIEKTINEN